MIDCQLQISQQMSTNSTSLKIPDDELANTLTHAFGIAVAVIGAVLYFWIGMPKTPAINASFIAYIMSVIAVFTFSTLSHAVHRQPMRDRMRAWDQGVIYTMIAGTYTPFTVAYGGSLTIPLLLFIWIAAGIGFYSKVFASHRVNSMATITYLALGWVPAIPLSMSVPRECLYMMAGGGVAYSIGVLFLIYDNRVRYFHSVWHLMVIAAACVHYVGIYWFVLAA